MTLTTYSRCSIPYIDLEKQPEREQENEENKINFRWKHGDGFFSGRSNFKVILNFNDAIDNYQKYLNPNPDLNLEDASPYHDKLNALCFASSGWKPKYCEIIVKVGGKHLLEIGSGEEGNTPLICALKSKSDIKMLISELKSVNDDNELICELKSVNNVNKSFEDIIVKKVATLLELGANPNMANTAGKTPLWFAAEVNKNLTVIGMLLLKRPFMNPMPSEEGKERIKLAKIELISQAMIFDLVEIRELFNAKYDDDSSIKKHLNKDIFYVIILKIIEVFNYDQHLPNAVEYDEGLDIQICHCSSSGGAVKINL